MAADPKLMCSLCDGFLSEPKDLPCKHSFCEACLKTHCLATAIGDTFPCPACQKPVKVSDPNVPILDWPAGIPTNKVTAGRLEKMHVIVKEKLQFRCVLCAQKWLAVRATKYCKSCEEYFCDECGTQHWLLRASKEHRVFLIDDMQALKRDPYLQAHLVLMFNTRVRESKIQKKTNNMFTEPTNEKIRDENHCDISAATFLDNGQVLIIDKANERVKLFDKHFGFVSCIDLKCHDILQLNKYFIVASCPSDRCLKYLSLYKNELEVDHTVDLDYECYGLTRVRDNGAFFAVAFAGRPPRIVVYEGSKQRETICVSAGKLMMMRPDYLVYDRKRCLYFLSDSHNTCLKCVKPSGEIEWEKRIPECRGLVVFHDYLLVARSDRKTVDIINPAAQIVKSIVTVEDGLSNVRALSLELAVKGENSIRLLVMDDTELARVFVVEDPLMDRDIKSYLAKHQTSSNQGSTASLSSNKTNMDSSVCNIL